MRQKLQILRLGAALTLDGVRRANSYEATGNHGCRGALDDLVLEHLMVQRELARYSPRERMIVRLAAEGYTNIAISTRCGMSLRMVARRLHAYRKGLLFRDPRTAAL